MMKESSLLMEKKTKKLKESSFFRKFKKRSDEGASTLLTVMVVGLFVMIIAGSVAQVASFSAKTSRANSVETIQDKDVQTVLNAFEAYYYQRAALDTPSYSTAATAVAGVGTYRIYTSNATVQPTSISGASSTASTVPTAKWLIVQTVVNGETSVFVYEQFPKNTSRVITAPISTVGNLTTITNSKVHKAPGTTYVPPTVINSGANTSSITGSTFNSDLQFLTTNVATQNLTSSNVNGNVQVGQRAIATATKVNGSYCSNTTSTNTGSLGVSPTVSTSCITATTPQQSITTATTTVNLTAAQCTNFTTLKTLLESYTGDTERVVNAAGCATWSALNNTTAKVLNIASPITLVMNSGAMQNLTVNSKNTTKPVTFNLVVNTGATVNTTVTNNNFQHGPGINGGVFFTATTGQYFISNSTINGAVHASRAGSQLKLNNTTINYRPFVSSQVDLASNNPGMILRVS